jgi:hypothetical protein
MQDMTGVGFKTSEQHKDMGESRIMRDNKDTEIVLDYLKHASPFVGDERVLRSIATGVSSCDSCDVYDAKSTGQLILESMNGKSPDNYTFKKKDKLDQEPAPKSRCHPLICYDPRNE